MPFYLILISAILNISSSCLEDPPIRLEGKVRFDAFSLMLLEKENVQSYVELQPWQIEQFKLANEHFEKQLNDLQVLLNKSQQSQYQVDVIKQRIRNAKEGHIKDISILLMPEQIAGLFQLKMQMIKYPFVFKSELTGLMKVTSEQLASYQKVLRAYEAYLEQAVIKAGKSGSREVKLQALKEAQPHAERHFHNEVEKILSQQQRKQFDELCGKPLTLNLPTFQPETVLHMIEQKLIPKPVPRMIEPFPLAEILIVTRALDWAKVKAEQRQHVRLLAEKWIHDETSFYATLEKTPEQERENKLRLWHGERLFSHSKFVLELEKIVGETCRKQLQNCQLQLRGMTIFADKEVRSQLGISEEQYMDMMQGKGLKIQDRKEVKVEFKTGQSKSERRLYSRLPKEVERNWRSMLTLEQGVLWDNLLGNPIPEAELALIADEVIKNQTGRMPEEAFLDFLSKKK